MKQAVVVIHGMGEQIPMQTLNTFVDAVWTTDISLVEEARLDPATGEPRIKNCPSSYKVGLQSDLSIGGSGSFV